MTAKPALVAFLVAVAVPATLAAQDSTKPKPDSARAGMMDDHMMGPWKEMNAFHRVMGATWHPASHNGDMAPLKGRAKELLATAETWAASKPPSMPASCSSEPVRGAATMVVTETKALLALVDSGADDAKLKAALKSVHDAFEVAEKGCGGHGSYETAS
jgi:hypothetical protein